MPALPGTPARTLQRQRHWPWARSDSPPATAKEPEPACVRHSLDSPALTYRWSWRAPPAGSAGPALPLELACARLELANAAITEQPEVALAEARAAFDGFERLR